MASQSRRGARDLIEEIRNAGPGFRFFQAVRLLALSAEGEGGKAPIPPGLRFGSPVSLGFPGSEIASVESRGDSGGEHSLLMTVGFLGLTGPSGALPVPYTELLIERRNHYRDDAAHQFLDLFTHRAASLFYRAWRKYRFYLPYEAGERDGFSRHLLDLVGVGLRQLQDRLEASGRGIPDRFLIHYAGILSQRPISAANIAAVVRGYFGVDASLEQFVGQWMHLPACEQSVLGENACRLGEDAVVGERIWDRQTKIRLRLGPMGAGSFAEFLPGRSGLTALRELIRFCVGFTLDCEVALVLKREEVPPPMIPARMSPQLGFNVWLNSRPPRRDAEDVAFALFA